MERSPFFMEMEVELSAHLLEFLFLLSDGPCDTEQLASGRRTPTRRRKWAVGDILREERVVVCLLSPLIKRRSWSVLSTALTKE
jgi:hypothetical protein